MALNINDLRKQRQGAFYVSDQRICLTADGQLVSCEDTRAVRLLVGAGARLPVAVAEQYGLIGKPEPEEASEEPKARNALANKARKGQEDKS